MFTAVHLLLACTIQSTHSQTISLRTGTRQKVVGSTPDGVIDLFFSVLSPSGRTMDSGFTQPVTEMSPGRFLGLKSNRRVRLTT
jgi:hypothetical protein